MSDRIWLIGDYNQAEVRVAAWAGPIPSLKTWFQEGQDIHIKVAQLIGKVVEENKIKLPSRLIDGTSYVPWTRKPYQELTKKDKIDAGLERDLAKRTVHANTNGMGPVQFGIITGLPIRAATIVQDVYHSLFPEIRGNYHRGIREQLQATRTLTNPLGWKRTFYDIYGPALEREAYAWYPQSTIGLLTVRTWTRCCEAFREHWSQEPKILTPSMIRSMGYDLQLQVHDSIGVSIQNNPQNIAITAQIIKEIAEFPLIIKGETLVIPMDFKIGPSWGELHDYVIES